MLMSDYLRSILREKAGEGEGSSSDKGEKDSADDKGGEGESEEGEESGEGDEEGDEEESEEGEEGKDEFDEVQLSEAKNLYRLLKDPNTQTETLRILAQKAGILTKDGERPLDKKEEKAAIKSTVKIL